MLVNDLVYVREICGETVDTIAFIPWGIDIKMIYRIYPVSVFLIDDASAEPMHIVFSLDNLRHRAVRAIRHVLFGDWRTFVAQYVIDIRQRKRQGGKRIQLQDIVSAHCVRTVVQVPLPLHAGSAGGNNAQRCLVEKLHSAAPSQILLLGSHVVSAVVSLICGYWLTFFAEIHTSGLRSP